MFLLKLKYLLAFFIAAPEGGSGDNVSCEVLQFGRNVNFARSLRVGQLLESIHKGATAHGKSRYHPLANENLLVNYIAI